MIGRRRLVLYAVQDAIAAGGSPTMRALSAQLGLSRSIVQRHVTSLIEGGYLKPLGAGRTRGLEVVKLPGMSLLTSELAWCNANPGRVRAMMALDAEIRS